MPTRVGGADYVLHADSGGTVVGGVQAIVKSLAAERLTSWVTGADKVNAERPFGGSAILGPILPTPLRRPQDALRASTELPTDRLVASASSASRSSADLRPMKWRYHTSAVSSNQIRFP
jgi:hypothetical protein